MPSTFMAYGFMALLGLCLGSFLNVLIHRLPIMIEQAWAQPLEPDAPHEAPDFNLACPASHCPACQHALAWHDKLPLLSFVRLRGRCRHCAAPISWQYPLIELATAAIFVWSLWAHGPSAAALAWAGFASSLLALAVIDARTTWLPDALTQPLTWAGLIAAACGWSGLPLADALGGAVVGYMSLWSVHWGFRLITGKTGMGEGDFKLLAALGAWLGWQNLLALVLIASVSGLLVALVLLGRGRLPDNRQIAFGPYLALAGASIVFFGTPAPLQL
ncbi:MAG: prepilin peptidase [Betaproteobacteria bacterium]|nr:prepilin peptidase [Betaproteobacteria bacterium]